MWGKREEVGMKDRALLPTQSNLYLNKSTSATTEGAQCRISIVSWLFFLEQSLLNWDSALTTWTVAKERKHQSAHQKADDLVCRAVMSYVLSPWKPKSNPDYPHWENSQAFSISHSLFYILHWACVLPQRKARASSVLWHYGVCMCVYVSVCICVCVCCVWVCVQLVFKCKYKNDTSIYLDMPLSFICLF